MKPKLRCRVGELSRISARYSYPVEDSQITKLVPGVRKRGHLTKAELQLMATWKSKRSAGQVSGNSEEYVREITGAAFASRTERARIEVLTLLDGVGWPSASVLLHFFHPDPYPILDFRALWSVSIPQPAQYDFALWWAYVEICRELSTRSGLDMRTLDRALWQYSKENQAP